MSNEMISVPRDWARDYAKLLDSALEYGAAEEVRALLAKHAEPHQGETAAPIVIEVKDSCVYLRSGPLDPGQHRLYTRPAEQPDTGTSSDKYKAELYDEVWQLARDMGFGNVTDALMKLRGNKS